MISALSVGAFLIALSLFCGVWITVSCVIRVRLALRRGIGAGCGASVDRLFDSGVLTRGPR